jgi:nicotinate-nucleotide adenylyltransferase
MRARGGLHVRTPPAPPGRRIGVMGGSFDPPHAGHMVVAETALRRLRLDAVWWLVTPGNPLKGHGGLAPLAERMAACRRLARHPRMHVTAFEADLGSAYTAVTLTFLVRRHPGVRFAWLIGADNLAGFHRWQGWRRIAALMPVVVVDRPGWRYRALAAPAARALARRRVPERAARRLVARARRPGLVLLSTRLSAASSTALRRQRAAASTGAPGAV